LAEDPISMETKAGAAASWAVRRRKGSDIYIIIGLLPAPKVEETGMSTASARLKNIVRQGREIQEKPGTKRKLRHTA